MPACTVPIAGLSLGRRRAAGPGPRLTSRYALCLSRSWTPGRSPKPGQPLHDAAPVSRYASPQRPFSSAECPHPGRDAPHNADYAVCGNDQRGGLSLTHIVRLCTPTRSRRERLAAYLRSPLLLKLAYLIIE